jgi:hypothetical protein
MYDNNIIYCQTVSELCIGYMYDNNIIYCQTVSELCIWYIYDNNIIYYQTVSEHWITYMYDNSIAYTQRYHNAQNKPMICQKEILAIAFLLLVLINYII